MKLCQVFDIHTSLTSCHRHNEEQKGDWLAEKMIAEDIDIALTTDAGTPGVSDPGFALVRACAERGIEVLAVPGCCAAAAAISVSGFDTREWAFYGFLPREKKELREKLLQIARESRIAVIHESPFRILDLMQMIAETLPEAEVSASCDLTKLHELTIRGRAADVLAKMQENPKTEKGEYCLVLDLHAVQLPEEQAAPSQSPEAALVDQMLTGMDLRGAQEALVRGGMRKNTAKAAALRLKRLLEEITS